MEIWTIFMYEGSHKAALLGLSGSASSLMQPQQLIQCWPALDFSQGLSNILRRQHIGSLNIVFFFNFAKPHPQIFLKCSHFAVIQIIHCQI
jgi:hypothetical protein